MVQAPVLSPSSPVEEVDQDQPVRVLVVDDSAVVRGTFSRWLSEKPDFEVAGTAMNGAVAVRFVERTPVDVIVLDVEMPEMGGLQALPLLLAACPHVQILMASTVTTRNAEISLKALELGATECLAKPQSGRLAHGGLDFQRDFLEKVATLGQLARQQRRVSARSVPSEAPSALAALQKMRRAAPPVVLAPVGVIKRPQALVIGCSTGGPQALHTLFTVLRRIRVPVLITQHMPPMFTAILAQHLSRLGDVEALEAEHGEAIVPGRVYVAPGGKHLLVAGTSERPTVALTEGPAENYCRPSVDPMFRSAAACWGDRLLAVVLTGMGQDGKAGAQQVVAAGGHVMVQDEASSVVWGMPGAVAKAGCAHWIKPLDQMGPALLALSEGQFS